MPALLTICEQNNSNIVAVIQQIVDLITQEAELQAQKDEQTQN